MKKQDVVVKKSNIGQFKNGKGVFANKDFKKGEIVIVYNLKKLTNREFDELPSEEKTFTPKRGGVIYLYGIPERYVNHEKNPNTVQDFKKNIDIAKRDIKKGEEITTDATKEDF